MDQSPIFDAQYLELVRARDEATLNHLYNYFNIPIRNLLRHRQRAGGGADVIGDLVQDVFVALLKGIDKGNPQDPAKLPNYVAGIARYTWPRPRRFSFDDVDVAGLADLKVSPEALLIMAADEEKVREVLSRLKERDRQVLEAIFFRELNRAEAALELGVTRDRLKGILFHALQRFRRNWDRLDESDDRPEQKRKAS